MSLNLDFVKIQDQYFVDEQEEEALSLCDLPISEIVTSSGKETGKEVEFATNGEDSSFDFGLLIGSVDELGFEMCSADEVFSGGQILPFRHSVSSEGGLSRTVNFSNQSISRSGSTNRGGLCSRSSSTRSNSIRSQYSSTSSTSTSSNNTSTSVKTFPIPKTRGRNNFHSHPSPKPRVWATGTRGSTPNYTTPMLKKSTMWEVLKLGLVRTPEIELQDLKQRHRTSTSRNTTTFVIPRNNSSNSSNRNNNNNNNNNNHRKMSDLLVELNKKKNYNGGFFKSCKCSVLAIEPIPTRQYDTKSNYFGAKISNGPKSNSKFSTNYVHLVKDDKELEQKKVRVQEQKKQIHRQVKKVMSHHYRTFEWLRDLSHANVLNS